MKKLVNRYLITLVNLRVFKYNRKKTKFTGKMIEEIQDISTFIFKKTK